jgi:NAD(P)-dependent dehydrogenase (short-subunit alcohol dehydrogenase family)
MAVNAGFLVLLANALSGQLKHSEPAVFASLSARVGSITDNGLGGWYSYRASKAAHNMLLKTLAREWGVSHKNVCLLALHPGTVATRLSEPFVTESYRKRVLTTAECSAALLQVIGGTTARQSGSFLSWEGEEIPW